MNKLLIKNKFCKQIKKPLDKFKKVCYNIYIKRKERSKAPQGKLKMFRIILLDQFTSMPERYEIETNTEKELSVWDKEDKTSFTFHFKENGDLKEIW